MSRPRREHRREMEEEEWREATTTNFIAKPIPSLLPNTFTLGFVLKACYQLSRFYEGKLVHSMIVKMDLSVGMPVFNGLLKLYVNCGCVGSARKVFDEMRERDRASWNVMISGLVNNGFREMQVQGVDMYEFTLASVVRTCGHLGALYLGKWVHSYIDKEGVKVDVVLGTCLVDMYSKCWVLVGFGFIILMKKSVPAMIIGNILLKALHLCVSQL